MSFSSFKNFINEMFANHIYLIYTRVQWLVCHKTTPSTHTLPQTNHLKVNGTLAMKLYPTPKSSSDEDFIDHTTVFCLFLFAALV